MPQQALVEPQKLESVPVPVLAGQRPSPATHLSQACQHAVHLSASHASLRDLFNFHHQQRHVDHIAHDPLLSRQRDADDRLHRRTKSHGDNLRITDKEYRHADKSRHKTDDHHNYKHYHQNNHKRPTGIVADGNGIYKFGSHPHPCRSPATAAAAAAAAAAATPASDVGTPHAAASSKGGASIRCVSDRKKAPAPARQTASGSRGQPSPGPGPASNNGSASALSRRHRRLHRPPLLNPEILNKDLPPLPPPPPPPLLLSPEAESGSCLDSTRQPSTAETTITGVESSHLASSSSQASASSPTSPFPYPLIFVAAPPSPPMSPLPAVVPPLAGTSFSSTETVLVRTPGKQRESIGELSNASEETQASDSSEFDVPSGAVHDSELEPLGPEDAKRIRKKYNLIRELVDTEETFATDMAVVKDIYHRKMTEDKYAGYLSRAEMDALFEHVDDILVNARQFVSLLKEKINGYALAVTKAARTGGEVADLRDVDTGVGEVVLEVLPVLEGAYRAYCDGNAAQMDTFYRVRALACPQIDMWLDECLRESKDVTTAWTLDALLIKPVQRLLKYPLLLSGMLETSTKDSRDYYSLERALAYLQEAVDRINSEHPPSTPTLGAAPASPRQSPKATPQTSPRSSPRSSPWRSPRSRRSMSPLSPPAVGLWGLRTDPAADGALEDKLRKFFAKRHELRAVIDALRTDSTAVETHFDRNEQLAKAWVAWAQCLPDAKSNAAVKRYEQYAYFSVPFTSASKTQLSTSRLAGRIEHDVIRVLERVADMFDRTAAIEADRRRFHSIYAKYVASRSDLSYGAPAMQATVASSLSLQDKQRADLFVKYHNALRDGLDDLFALSQRVVECCLARHVSIKRQWLRQSMDTMASVFKLSPDDVAVNLPSNQPISPDSTPTEAHTQPADSIVDKYHDNVSDCERKLRALTICQATDSESLLSSDTESMFDLAPTTTITTIDDTSSIFPRRILRSKRSIPRNWSLQGKLSMPRIPHRQLSLFDLSSASKLRLSS